MDGGDRAGYKLISRNCDCILITSTMKAVSITTSTAIYDKFPDGWAYFEVVSSAAAIAAITANGMSYSSKMTSARALSQGARIGAGSITKIKLSTKSSYHKVIAYKKILI